MTPVLRLQTIGFCAGLPILLTAGVLAVAPIAAALATTNPLARELSDHVRLLEHITARFPQMAAERTAIEVVIAGRFRESLRTLPDVQTVLNPRRRAVAQRIIGARAAPSDAELAEAERMIAPLIAQPERVGFRPPPRLRTILTAIISTGWALAGIMGVALAFALRGGLSLRLANAVIVTSDGAPATRRRAVARAAVAWGPLLAVVGVFAVSAEQFHRVPLHAHIGPATEPGLFAWLTCAVLTAVFVAGVIAAVVSPGRGWQDRVAGTWIVPR